MIRELLRDVTPLEAVMYVLATIVAIGCIWIVASVYIVTFTP